MKSIAIIAILIIVGTFAFAQQPTAPAAPAQVTNSAVPDGTVIRVELKNKLDSKKARIGDPVTLEVLEDAKAPDGKVVLPKKTRLTGKISEADPSTKESPDAKLSFLITTALVKGQALPMTGYMIPPFKAPEPMQAVDRSFIDAANKRSDTGYMTKDDPTAGKGPSAGADASGLEGIRLKLDPRIGTYLVADKKNIVLEGGTVFHVKQATLPPPPGSAK